MVNNADSDQMSHSATPDLCPLFAQTGFIHLGLTKIP